ncbi:MAG TPA: hypothetical protein VGU23_04130, partial [Acidobacteriaceae bacterium]|nr:hypothetical protein [Acidobacteriaceae bacterium]
MISFYERRRYVGLAVGSLILVAFPFPFAVWSLVAAGTRLASLLLVAMAVGAAGMIGWAVATIRAVRGLAHGAEGDAALGRRITFQYWAVVAAEYVGIAVVCLVCGNRRHWMYIPPLIDVVVGLHFLPLAWIFKVSRYYVAGGLFCAIALGTMWWMPPSAYVGHALGWLVVPPVGCSAVGLGTGWDGLNEVRRFLGGVR